MKKLKTGILGLDSLLDGGFNEHSATIVVGSAGTGKTTMALQFLRKGLETGSDAIYITLEESRAQIMEEARSMGWDDIEKYVEQGSLVFLEAGGKDMADFIKEELPQFVSEWEGSHARIAIDPLTPVIWAYENKYEQRALISDLFKQAKRVGTVLSTVEEHGTTGEMTGGETIIPMYLADTVVHLSVLGMGELQRALKISKSRQSWHSEGGYPYRFVLGIGFIVDTSAADGKKVAKLEIKDKQRVQEIGSQERVKKIVGYLEKADLGDMTPGQIIDMLIEDYKVTP
ncbi:MAG TPA: ATPase domain-containing protein [Methanocella sp.]|nr:ATPase domain-containing protein [Methanocella sp.]